MRCSFIINILNFLFFCGQTQKEQEEETRQIEQERIDKENEIALEKERQTLAEALQRVAAEPGKNQ